uniref:Uncharacterized protein n=1 Tax=Parascaris equorum TaxID=6256 RepID=A0A914RVK3_PAREQ
MVGSESTPKQLYLAIRFIFQFIYCLLFRDLPRVLFLKRKSVEDQVVVITGGARGVGRGLARRFAINERAIVCILDINEVDVLICNAAVLRLGQLVNMSDDDFKITMNVNVLGYIFTIRSFLAEMINRNKGQVVAIGSICSHYGENLGSAYWWQLFPLRMSESSIITDTMNEYSLQMELDEMNKNGVCVTTIYPYFIDTPLIAEKKMEPFST